MNHRPSILHRPLKKTPISANTENLAREYAEEQVRLLADEPEYVGLGGLQMSMLPSIDCFNGISDKTLWQEYWTLKARLRQDNEERLRRSLYTTQDDVQQNKWGSLP